MQIRILQIWIYQWWCSSISDQRIHIKFSQQTNEQTWRDTPIGRHSTVVDRLSIYWSPLEGWAKRYFLLGLQKYIYINVKNCFGTCIMVRNNPNEARVSLGMPIRMRRKLVTPSVAANANWKTRFLPEVLLTKYCLFFYFYIKKFVPFQSSRWRASISSAWGREFSTASNTFRWFPAPVPRLLVPLPAWPCTMSRQNIDNHHFFTQKYVAIR